MDTARNIKTAIILFCAALTARLGMMAIPIYVMVASNIIDYITGIIVAPKRGQKIDSAVALYGLTKKVAMWILVIVGWIIDILLKYAISQMGIGIKLDFFIAAIVAVWIGINEIISILENLNDIGAPVPKFMHKVMKHLKSEIEELTGEGEE